MSVFTILIVDDDADLRTILLRVFKRDPYTLLEAADGDEALRVCRTQPPDLVLLDIMMPRLEGVSTCEQIRALPGMQHVPILMVTALEDPTSIEQSFRAGATDYVTEPINLSVLRQRVRYLLRGAEAEAQLRASESRLRSIIEVSTDAVILIDAEQRIQLFNPAAERLFGYRADEICGQPLDDHLLVQSLPIDLPQLAAKTSFEARGRHVNGTEFPLEGSIGWFDDNGQIMYTVTLRDVSERVQSQAALLESEERYRLITDNMTDTVWLVDANLNLLYVSPSAARARGLTLDEIKATPFAAQITQQSMQRVMSALGSVLSHELTATLPRRISRTMELEIVRKDRSTYWEEITATIILDERGQPQSIVGVGRDITERKRMEAALRQSEERYRLITENMTDAVWLMDLQMNTVYVSPAVERTLGYNFTEIQQLTSRRQLLTPDSQRVIVEVFQRYFAPDKISHNPPDAVYTCELEYYRRDGTSMWSELRLTLVRDFEGRPSGILSVGRDITERRKTEEKILRLNEDLAQRARELAALNAASRALTSSLELRHVLETVVREIQVLLNTERSSVLLRDSASADLVFAAVAGESSDILIGTRVPIDAGVAGWVAREGQAALVEDVRQDPRFWNEADARTGYVTRSVLAVPIKFRNMVWGVAEAVNRHGGPFTDHERDMLEALASSAAIAIENARLYQAEREQSQQLQESQARLVHAEKMSALGRLVASLTHEINNPLQAVQSGLYLIREELGMDPANADILHDVNIIDGEVRRISNLMQRLREFSRPVQMESRSTNLNSILDNIVELIGKQLERQGIATIRHWDPQLPQLMVSPDQLTQVFMNLALNAIDAMPDGGELTLSTALEREADGMLNVRVNVGDSGDGIPPDVLKRIFEPFFTTKTTGTGLGLSISYEIIQSMGGDIFANSTPGSGTVFSVKLPVRTPA